MNFSHTLLDMAVRPVGIKEVYTLKWHRSFDTKNAWTLAGGVTPADWVNASAEWLVKYPDY